MVRRESRDTWLLKMDLVDSLIYKGYIKPGNSIHTNTIIDNWFAEGESEAAKEIITKLADPDNPAPLEYKNQNKEEIWVTDVEDGEDFIKSIERDPWYDD